MNSRREDKIFLGDFDFLFFLLAMRGSTSPPSECKVYFVSSFILGVGIASVQQEGSTKQKQNKTKPVGVLHKLGIILESFSHGAMNEYSCSFTALAKLGLSCL